MPNTSNIDRYAEYYRALRECGCAGQSSFARMIGRPIGSIRGILANMEAAGYLLSEDDRGNLYPYSMPRGI